MSDLIYLLVTVAFFALATGFVHVCDRIVGRAETPPSGASGPATAPVLTGRDA